MEQWKSIKGYEGYYEVSNLGNVRSVDRTDSIGRKRKGKVLSPSISQGYYGVNLCKNSNPEYLRIHRLVAEAFLVKKETDEDINHINGIKIDNRLANLEYCTHRENLCKAVTEKHRKTSVNQFSEEEIIQILKDVYSTVCDGRKNISEVALKHNINMFTINQIVDRKSRYMLEIPKQNFEIEEQNKYNFAIRRRNLEIADLVKHGFYQIDISKIYKVDFTNVSKICKHLNLGRYHSKYRLI